MGQSSAASADDGKGNFADPSTDGDAAINARLREVTRRCREAIGLPPERPREPELFDTGSVPVKRRRSTGQQVQSRPSGLLLKAVVDRMRKSQRRPKGWGHYAIPLAAVDVVSMIDAAVPGAASVFLNVQRRELTPWAQSTSFEIEVAVGDLARECGIADRKAKRILELFEAGTLCHLFRPPGKPLRVRFVWGAKGWLNPDLFQPSIERVLPLLTEAEMARLEKARWCCAAPGGGAVQHHPTNDAVGVVENSASSEPATIPVVSDDPMHTRAGVAGERSQCLVDAAGAAAPSTRSAPTARPEVGTAERAARGGASVTPRAHDVELEHNARSAPPEAARTSEQQSNLGEGGGVETTMAASFEEPRAPNELAATAGDATFHDMPDASRAARALTQNGDGDAIAPNKLRRRMRVAAARNPLPRRKGAPRPRTDRGGFWLPRRCSPDGGAVVGLGAGTTEADLREAFGIPPDVPLRPACALRGYDDSILAAS